MSDLLGTLMINPVHLAGWQQLLMLLPLCLSVSLVYKTTKCERVSDIPMATLVSWITIIVGMFAVGAALLLIFETAT